ncbi:MAG: hypothetical protein ABIF85_01120 [Nanoarchaeota archaeon]|nr:hypothetical protein [Nanoarchaeota archaeon]MBU4299665.1 hypothetical protein [Nanoarchaeota archaeon]MBU4451472.1 hypothetical protein [Nanoarchaeota archaeon]MCG2723392.1 hypothetical protein [archaeon]
MRQKNIPQIHDSKGIKRDGYYAIDDFMRKKINGYISSIMEESALIKDGGMLFLASFAGSIFLFIANGPEGFGNLQPKVVKPRTSEAK